MPVHPVHESIRGGRRSENVAPPIRPADKDLQIERNNNYNASNRKYLSAWSAWFIAVTTNCTDTGFPPRIHGSGCDFSLSLFLSRFDRTIFVIHPSAVIIPLQCISRYEPLLFFELIIVLESKTKLTVLNVKTLLKIEIKIRKNDVVTSIHRFVPMYNTNEIIISKTIIMKKEKLLSFRLLACASEYFLSDSWSDWQTVHGIDTLNTRSSKLCWSGGGGEKAANIGGCIPPPIHLSRCIDMVMRQ